MAADWLAQNTRAAHLHAAIAGAVVQLHHALGFAYADNYLTPEYPTTLSQQSEDPTLSVADNFNRLDIDSGVSLASLSADATARRAAIQAIAATSSALEGSVGQQMDGLPDSSSTATRFEWGNAPPGTAANWDAPSCTSVNAYEDPGCPGARRFVQFTAANYLKASSVALVEANAASTYTQDPMMGVTQQPIMGATQASAWQSTYDSEIASYANCAATSSCGTPGNVPFKVTTSQETFLGPGQRAGAYEFQSATLHCTFECANSTVILGYYTSVSRQRGPAFVATAYDANGDPVAIAHDVVGLDSAVGPSSPATAVITKGGGGGAQPDQQEKYNPAEAADALKARFVDKSNALGVNLSNGSIGYVAPAKLDVGSGGFPYELTAELEWHPAPFPISTPISSPVAPPAGWTTNWHNALVISGSGLEAMGKSDVRASVGTIAAFLAEQDIYKSAPSTQRDVAAVLTQSWWVHQLSGNVVTATLGTSSRQFVALPQGVSLPGSTYKLDFHRWRLRHPDDDEPAGRLRADLLTGNGQ